jgi:hypothetical protein
MSMASRFHCMLPIRRREEAGRRRRKVSLILEAPQRLEDRSLLSVYTVTSLADDRSAGTLRSILQQVDSDTSPDTVDFDLPGSAPYVIQPLSPCRRSPLPWRSMPRVSRVTREHRAWKSTGASPCRSHH